jgi:hypothetical protein
MAPASSKIAGDENLVTVIKEALYHSMLKNNGGRVMSSIAFVIGLYLIKLRYDCKVSEKKMDLHNRELEKFYADNTASKNVPQVPTKK